MLAVARPPAECPIEKLFQIFGQWRHYVQFLVHEGMRHLVAMRVERMAWQLEQREIRLRQFTVCSACQQSLIGTIQFITHHRAPNAR